MNDLKARRDKIAALTADMERHLAAADADGLTAEARQQHLDAFDAAEKARGDEKAALARAERLAASKTDDAAISARHETEAATKPVVAQPYVPPQAGGGKLPARPRAYGNPRHFKGPDAAERAEVCGLWAAATLYGSDRHRQYLADHHGIVPQATLSTVSNGGAAYFIPEPISYDILKLQEEYGVFRRNAQVVQMGSETWKVPRWTAGMTGYWVAEGSAPTASDPGYDMVELVAKNLAAKTKMTRQLNESAIVSLGDEIAEAIAVAFSNAEDNAGFNGDGTSTYGGITGLFPKVVLAANAASLVTATGHSTLATLTLDDFQTVLGTFPSYPGAMPKWFCHKSVWAASMMRLQMAAGGTTPDHIAGGSGTMFLGYPVEFVNVAPVSTSVTTGVTGILFADLRLAAKLGDRRAQTVESGWENDDFTKQLITILGTAREDVVVHTVVDPKNSSKAGPVVGLKLA